MRVGSDISVDLDKVQARKRDVVQSFRSGNRDGLESADNIELIDGDARFVAAAGDGVQKSSAHEIEVKLNAGGTRRLRADKIFINVGARPSFPPIDGLDEAMETGRVLNSTTMMETEGRFRRTC